MSEWAQVAVCEVVRANNRRAVVVRTDEPEAEAAWSYVLQKVWQQGGWTGGDAGLRAMFSAALRVAMLDRLWSENEGYKATRDLVAFKRRCEPSASDEPLSSEWATRLYALAPKQRAAVADVVLQGREVATVAAESGVHRQVLHMRLAGGLDNLRAMYNGTYRSKADAARAAHQRRAQGQTPP